MKKYVYWLSLALNLVFIIGFLLNKFNSLSNRIGILKKDIIVGYFMGKKTIFTLPKGLTVRDKSERGISAIGQFENERFSIVITSNDNIVDYNVSKDSLNMFDNYYSADIEKDDE